MPESSGATPVRRLAESCWETRNCDSWYKSTRKGGYAVRAMPGLTPRLVSCQQLGLPARIRD